MGHTNSTVNYNLPQFVGTDKPSWLGDVNGAFLAIDTAIAAAKSTADSAAGGVASLQTTVGGHTTQIGTLTDTVTAQGGTLNAVTALIGNGTPTTTDQTIIGAINELNAARKVSTSYVDITSYTSDNQYQFPSDGYVFKGSVTTPNQSMTMRYDDVFSTRFVPTSVNDGQTDVVFKGMKAYVQSNSAGGTFLFYPLVIR